MRALRSCSFRSAARRVLAGAVLFIPGTGPGHNTPVNPPKPPPPTATVVPADPVPNTEDPVSGAPLDGGVRYSWTINLAANTSATFEGATGAWGWDDDGLSGTPLGHTEAATWVALNLKSPSRVRIRVARKADAVDALAVFPGETGGNNLLPAFTLFSGWDGDGGDEATFHNRGEVSWAEDLTYLGHVENSGEAVEADYELEAGLYTLVLGGASTSLVPEPRQGYEASLSSVSLEKNPKLSYKGGKNRVTTRPALKLSGRVGLPGEITSVRIYHHGKTRLVRVKGSSAWATKITALSFGKNTVWITPVSKYGTVFRPQKFTVIRK
ncbi:MAG: hypothetical protein KDN18_18010 [Verrucomicrobiae bacterium]|nr:hypothetical protein [Verrucomicrobiae bacterium]